MKVKRKITFDTKNKMNVHISFNEMLEEYRVIVISSFVAYFVQNKLDICIDDNKVYLGDKLLLEVVINNHTIDCILDDKAIKINPRIIFIGIQTYLNIYFNLYETNQYDKVEMFYQENKKK